MKDVTNDDMRRGAVSTLRSGDFRMGEPRCFNRHLSITEYIGCEKVTQGTDTSKYLEEKKVKTITLVVASETVTAQP